MGWSEAGADAMCQLRCYVKDYGEEKVGKLVRYCREQRHGRATGIDGMVIVPERISMQTLLHQKHDNNKVYIEKMQATISSVEIRKKLAIRERIKGI